MSWPSLIVKTHIYSYTYDGGHKLESLFLINKFTLNNLAHYLVIEVHHQVMIYNLLIKSLNLILIEVFSEIPIIPQLSIKRSEKQFFRK